MYNPYIKKYSKRKSFETNTPPTSYYVSDVGGVLVFLLLAWWVCARARHLRKKQENQHTNV